MQSFCFYVYENSALHEKKYVKGLFNFVSIVLPAWMISFITVLT